MSEGGFLLLASVASEASGTVVAADFRSVVRIDPVTGTREVVSAGLGYTPGFAELTDIVVVPGNPPDGDGDATADGFDNCLSISNFDQADRDGNGVGDACNEAEDADGDEWADELDNCPDAGNADQADLDGDGLGDPCDPFPTQADHVLAQALADLDEARSELALVQQTLADTQAELTATQEALAECQGELTQCSDPPTPCSDGLDNDGDGLIDYPSDPHCWGPEDASERRSGCGLGFELALVLPLLMAAGRRRQGFGGENATLRPTCVPGRLVPDSDGNIAASSAVASNAGRLSRRLSIGD